MQCLASSALDQMQVDTHTTHYSEFIVVYSDKEEITGKEGWYMHIIDCAAI